MSDTPEDPINAQAPHQADIACPECGAPFAPRGNKRFCQRKCQADFNNRMAAEGKILAPLVKAMMATRGGGHKAALPICGAARTELTRIAKIFNDADKAAGRPPVHLYVERLFDSQVFYMDRRRLPEPLDGGSGWSPHQRQPARRRLAAADVAETFHQAGLAGNGCSFTIGAETAEIIKGRVVRGA